MCIYDIKGQFLSAVASSFGAFVSFLSAVVSYLSA